MDLISFGIFVHFCVSVDIRPRFFYLLDYISLSGFSKCGDGKKK